MKIIKFKYVFLIIIVFQCAISFTYAGNAKGDFTAEKEGKENSWRYSNGEFIYSEIDQLKDNKLRAATGNNAIAQGIDVSSHQGKINWDAVKQSGIDFAIIRCGYGMDFEDQDDSYWEYNVSECERLNIPYGVYLYSYADSVYRASSEADHVLRLLSGHSPEYPVYYDLEENSLASTNNIKLLGQIAKTFCDKISTVCFVLGGFYDSLTGDMRSYMFVHDYECTVFSAC